MVIRWVVVRRDEEDAIRFLETVFCGILDFGDFISLLESSVKHISRPYAV